MSRTPTQPGKPLTIGIVQMAAGIGVEANAAKIRAALQQLAGNCDLAVLPENCLCQGSHATVRAAALPPQAMAAKLRDLRADFPGAVLFGGVPVRNRGGAVFNRGLLFVQDGRLLASYDKMHLFRLSRGAATAAVDETSLYTPGARPADFSLQGWRCGLGICYDLRFPELWRGYAPAPAMLCTAAFTHATGEAHWELLLRARAVENQCYMVGVNQCGANPETGIANFGHSLVADPWGRILTDAGTEECTRTVTLEPEKLREVRRRLPALGKPTLYKAARAWRHGETP